MVKYSQKVEKIRQDRDARSLGIVFTFREKNKSETGDMQNRQIRPDGADLASLSSAAPRVQSVPKTNPRHRGRIFWACRRRIILLFMIVMVSAVGLSAVRGTLLQSLSRVWFSLAA